MDAVSALLESLAVLGSVLSREVCMNVLKRASLTG